MDVIGFIIWVALSVLLGFFASLIAASKGRTGSWGWATFLFLPAFVIMVMLDSKTPAKDAKVCPRCAESVKAPALVCRYCGSEFPPSSVEAEAAQGLSQEAVT